jgi:hypothetical protein
MARPHPPFRLMSMGCWPEYDGFCWSAAPLGVECFFTAVDTEERDLIDSDPNSYRLNAVALFGAGLKI